MNIIYFFCLLTLGQGVFLSIHIFISQKEVLLKRAIFALIILIEVLTLYDEIILFFSNTNLPIQLYYLGTPLLPAIGPLLLVYIYLSSNRKLNWVWLFHFVPVLITILFAISNYHILSITEKQDYISFFQNSLVAENTTRSLLELLINNSMRLQILIYAILSWFFLYQNKKKYHSKVSIGVVQYLCIGLMVIALLSILMEIHILSLKGYSLWRFALFLMIFSSNIFALTYVYFQPNSSTKTDKYKHSGLSKEEEKQIRENLNRLIQEEEIYLNPLLTLQKLAEASNTNIHYLSQVINSIYGKTFNELMNTYRVEKVKQLLQQIDNQSMEEIATLSGFGSPSSFFRIFKQHTGLTPGQFRKQLKTHP